MTAGVPGIQRCECERIELYEERGLQGRNTSKVGHVEENTEHFGYGNRTEVCKASRQKPNSRCKVNTPWILAIPGGGCVSLNRSGIDSCSYWLT